MVVPTYDAVKFPSDIETILITGAGGFVGQQLTEMLLKHQPHVKYITTDIVVPPNFGITDKSKLNPVKADLGDMAQVEALFKDQKIGGIFALHGIMSGGAEANFELGYAVNVDSNLNLLKAAHAHAKSSGHKPVYVFVSSLAVYGGPKCTPESYVVPDDTPVLAQSSYGVQKQISEMYVYDYGRKGYLDTRSVRLPTVAVRAGAPSSAASSFVSGLIREPLQGMVSECPIASSMDDPMLDKLPHYLSRTTTVVRNIAYSMCMPESKFKPGQSRSINLPGISVTPKQIIQALLKVGGEDKMQFVQFKPNQAVINICKVWAGNYDSSDAQDKGFQVDDKENGFVLAVEEFRDELKAQGTLVL